MADLSNSNLEKLLAEATKGPWVMVPWHIEEGPSAVRKADSSEYVCNTASDATASLIALTPDLAAEVLRLRKALETADAALTACIAHIPMSDIETTKTAIKYLTEIRAALDHQERSE